MSFLDKLLARFDEHQIQQLTRSYVLANKKERKGRLRAIMALSVELERIKEVSIFATSLGEGVIEDIIEGEWDSAYSVGQQHLTFKDEPKELQDRYTPLWTKFVDTLNVEYLLAEQRRKNPEGVEKSS